MDYLRQFADAGVCVLVVAAVSRQMDKSGRTSCAAAALSLASFRESSELEFGADDAYMLAPTDKPGEVALRHLKARQSEPKDICLRFDGARQESLRLDQADKLAVFFGVELTLPKAPAAANRKR